MPIKTERTCLHCNEPIFGRLDKKFCNSYCRNAYHNQSDPEASSYIRSVNRMLKNNRKILRRKLGTRDFAKVKRDELLVEGFRFDFHTSSFVNKKGQEYHYCYDLGYTQGSEKAITIVRKPEWLD